MKRKVFLSVFIMLLIFSLTLMILAEKQVYDFRKTNWGMNETQVKKIEDREILEIYEDGFAYKDTINELDCKIIYQFLENKLYITGYLFTELHTNYDFWIDDYQKIKEILIKKYGKPITSGMFWASDLYKEMWDNNQDLGTAVSMGYLIYYTEWDTPKTKIWIGLKGDNLDIDFRVTYESKELKEWADKIKEEKIKNDF